MRNRFNGSRRGRRPDSIGSVPGDSSPYDFTVRDEDGVDDPVDLLSIRADDELLDALGAGLSSFAGSDGRHALGVDQGLDDNINDDQQMLALLAAWRDEVRDVPLPELISVEDASKAIVAGHRSEYPKRRLISVAAAAAAVVVGMSGVALGAGNAKPGDTLWGVSKALNSDRASSVEAAQQVSVTLASVRQALAEGHVAEAQAKLASIAPVLNKVTDQETKTELSDTQANLVQTAETAKEGEKVKTDDSGKRDDGHDSDHDSDHGSGHNGDQHDGSNGGSNGRDPRFDGSKPDPRSDQPNPEDALRSEVLKSVDPRFSPERHGGQKPDGSTAPDAGGTGPGDQGSGTTTGQADPRRTVAPQTTEPKPSTKPTSGPRPSKWNPPPHKPDNGSGNNDGGGNGNGGNSGGGNARGGNNGGGGNAQQGQGKPDGQHKAEGEGEPADSGPQAQPAPQNQQPPQPGPRPVPPGS